MPVCSRSSLEEFVESELLARWRRGEPTLFRIEPEHVDSRIETAVESIIANNGTYQKKGNVVLHSRPAALPLAIETSHLLEKQGHRTCAVYNLLGDPSLLNRLLTALPNKRSLHKVVGQYETLVDFARHWVIPYATLSSEPDKSQRESGRVFAEVANKGLVEFDERLERGTIRSRDVIGFPVAHEAVRLGLSLAEWETILYKAMAVTKDEIEQEIQKTGYVKVLGQAYKGKTLRIIRKGNHPVDLTMKLTSRPVLKDVGNVGENAIYGKFFERTTNIPPGELFVAPIEDSVNGEFYTKLPKVDERGTIEGIHLVFKNGRVVEAKATRNEEALHYYVGLAKPGTESMKGAYEAQNTIAELGIGLNPVLDLEKVTGNTLIDEKTKGIHIATGTNRRMGGNTPGAVGGIAVEHTDFIVGKVDEIVAV